MYVIYEIIFSIKYILARENTYKIAESKRKIIVVKSFKERISCEYWNNI